jgi:hypothetical protein
MLKKELIGGGGETVQASSDCPSNLQTLGEVGLTAVLFLSHIKWL